MHLMQFALALALLVLYRFDGLSAAALVQVGGELKRRAVGNDEYVAVQPDEERVGTVKPAVVTQVVQGPW